MTKDRGWHRMLMIFINRVSFSLCHSERCTRDHPFHATWKREESCRLPHPCGDTHLPALGLRVDPSHSFGMTKGRWDDKREVG